MKMVKSLLLGTAAGLVAMTGAQAADLPVKAKPVQYVKICSLYGAGFYYIPGTDTCIKIGGFVRAEVDINSGGSYAVRQSGAIGSPVDPDLAFWRTRAGVTSILARRLSTARCVRTSSSHRRRTRPDRQQLGHVGACRPAPTAAPALATIRAARVARRTLVCGRTRRSSSSPASRLVRLRRSSTSTSSPIRTRPTSGARTMPAAASRCSPTPRSSATACRRRSRRKTRLHVACRSPTRQPLRRLLPPARVAQYGNVQVPDIVGNLRIDQTWGSAAGDGRLPSGRWR